MDIIKKYESTGFLSPYDAQKHVISELLREDDMNKDALLIENSQGQEFDLVILSLVRTNEDNYKELNRINEGI